MPFKLKLKKSRHYNVISKNLFVISVALLDKTTVECTLSAESTGQDCLHNVCQRQGIQQLEFFGLRMNSKRPKCRWVELEKPLKRQLEKYAIQDPATLYLGVMYYVSDIGHIQDEITRDYYFLQLKSDVVDGQLHCSQEQAIVLASYSLQAEFGDHDPERHTTQYLKSFFLLPKHMTSDEQYKLELIEKVAQAYKGLQGLMPTMAEVYYIMECMRLEGYGLEYLRAKDSMGHEIFLGISMLGIYVKRLSSRDSSYFKWCDISNLRHPKRALEIECEQLNQTVNCQLEDSEVAKYAWKLCVLQHKAYMKNEMAYACLRSEQDSAAILMRNENVTNALDLKESGNNGVPVLERNENLAEEQFEISNNPTVEELDRIVATQLVLEDSINTYHQYPGVGVDQHQQLQQQNLPLVQALSDSNQLLYHSSATSVQTPSQMSSQMLNSVYSVNSEGASVNACMTDVYASDSDKVLTDSNGALCSTEQLKVYLPKYRPAPDYEVALQQICKYGEDGGVREMPVEEIYKVQGPENSYHHQILMAQSNNSLLRTHNNNLEPRSYAHYKNFTDLTHLDALQYEGGIAHHHQHQHHHQHPGGGVMAAADCLHFSVPTHTYSTPDLTSHGGQPTIQMFFQDYFIKPPPAATTLHFVPTGQSASTPDLASGAARAGQNNNLSNPDLAAKQHAISVLQQQNRFPFVPNSAYCALPTHQQHQEEFGVAGLMAPDFNPQFNMQHLQQQQQQQHHLHQQQQQQIVFSGGLGGQFIKEPDFVESRSRSSSTQSAPELPMLNPHILHQLQQQQLQQQQQQQSSMQQQQQHLLQNQVPLGGALSPGPPPIANDVSVATTINRNELLMASSSAASVEKTKDSRCPILESKLNEGLVFMEFENIPRKRTNAIYMTANLQENSSLNRFKDVLPYEDNRVQLTPTKDNRTGYINASHISVTIGQQQRFYIASQGPLASTVVHFWQMIWEQHIGVVVMLTEIREQGCDKCFPYWPQDESQHKKMEYGDYQIIRKFSTRSSSFVTSSLVVTHIPSKRQRNVWQIQYTDWPDHGCPNDVQGFLGFMEEIDTVRRHAANQVPPGKGRNLPVLVHCSAGVGRTGVAILCDTMISCLDHNENVEIPKVLINLRQQRMLMVQTLAQYKFVYHVLIQYLKNSRLI